MFARRRAETSLKESEQRWRSVFEMSTVGVALADHNFRFQATNVAFQNMFGRTDEELRELSPLDISANEDRESLKLLFEQVREGHDCSDCFTLERLPGGACTTGKRRLETARRRHLPGGRCEIR
jgi:PAS domain S-box-containing protein